MLLEPRLYQWRSASYLYRSLGCLALWRRGSWLFQWSEVIGACLLSIIFMLAPFVSTSLIGVLLIATAAYWLLITVSEEPSLEVTPIHITVFIYWCIATIATAFSPVKSAALSGWVTLTLYLLMFALAARILRSPHFSNWIITSFLLIA